MKKEDLDYLEFKRKYKKKLAQALGDSVQEPNQITTNDYDKFKQAFMPKALTTYEQLCNFAEKIMPVKPDKKSIPALEDAIKVSHLNISPTGTLSFAVMSVFGIVLASVLLGFFLPFLLTGGTYTGGIFFVVFGVFLGMIMLIPISKLPFIISNSWRMKASNQMVLSVFYIVTYMRHTPNLELAIDFAAEHLAPPLSLDFKKIIWDIETGKYDNVNQSLDSYLLTWEKYNQEYIESMHLIQSSLYESSDSRRRDALDKSLQIILDETYEKMLHFTHDLKSPITTLHMLGIVLPILGLVILPLLSAFVPEAKWYHLFALYNIALPSLVYYMGRDILSTRPTGYGGVDITNLSPEREDNKITLKFKGNKSSELSVTPAFASVFILCMFLFIGLLPLIINAINPEFDFVIARDAGVTNIYNVDSGDIIYVKLMDYREIQSSSGESLGLHGPYGLGASILSLGLPLGFGLSIGLYNKWRSKKVEKIKERTQKLEQEFASALFQLGNRLADGIPPELAFQNVAKLMHGTQSGKFFDHVTVNIVKLGMGVEDAIFDPRVGALKEFPSSIIESSMKVFSESVKKGPVVASQAVITVAEYIKSMHRVDERLKDLMAEVVSSMKSQISFLTPAIAGIVVGITSMITQILGSLSEKMQQFSNASGGEVNIGTGILGSIGAGGIPTYFFQAIVGLYVVQITFVLTVLINGIQNGPDKLSEREMIGNNMIKSTLLYVAIAGAFTLLFSIIAISITANVDTSVL